MINENNVKIRINEYDTTSPAGAGIDSTDIAYIPGFSVLSDAPKNVPVLCTSVKEFEETFGSTSYQLTPADISSDYEALGFAEGDYDRSYIFAKELLSQGMSILYANIVDEESEGSVLDVFYALDESSKTFFAKNQLDVEEDGNISDKSLYSVKYITSGGYPSIINDGEKGKDIFASKLIKVAETRGDAIALIDYQMDSDDACYGEKSFYSKVSEVLASADESGYGTMMYPWANYRCVNSVNETVAMPASFAYLMCVAKAIKTSPNWLAMAGVSRGIVPNIEKLLARDNRVSNTAAEHMQPKYGEKDNKISVNCITDVRPYGLTLWGNRTLKPVDKDGCTALNFLNTRNMVSDIKKLLYTTAKSLMFEQNSDTLWLKFKSNIAPLLNQLKSGNGISDYKIIRGTTRYDGSALTKGELAAVIKITPIHAIEYFELSVEIRDDDVTVL